MNERTVLSMRKDLSFETSEDAFSIEITIENASSVSRESIAGFLDILYAKIRKEFLELSGT